MSRQVPHGTPTRAGRYQTPSVRRSAVAMSAVAAVVIAGAMVVSNRGGFRRTLSPGDLAAAHAPIDLRCVHCHDDTRTVVDLRCERCHDAAGTERLSHATHVLFGSGDSRKADRAEPQACVTCHVDHQGRRVTLSAVNDRECATCHQFARLSSHPEFAAVRAQRTTGSGIRFPHDKHVTEVKARSGGDCRACHEPTRDRSGFEPISFDRHCASCHVKGGFLTGETDPLSVDDLLMTAVAAGDGAPRLPVFRDEGRRAKVASNLVHRDPWVLLNAGRLGRSLDPESVAAERAVIRLQIDQLQQQAVLQPLSDLSESQLTAALGDVAQQLTSLDRSLAAAGEPGADDRALNAMAANVQSLSLQLDKVNSALSSNAQAIAATKVALEIGEAATADPQASARFEQRRAELVAMLTAIERRGDSALAGRAKSLKEQIGRLQAPGATRQVDRAALGQRLDALEDVFRALQLVPDTAVQQRLASADLLRQLARQRVDRGLSIDEFGLRRDELAVLLDEIDRRGGDTLRPRIAALRARLAGLQPGTSGRLALERRRRATARLYARLALERDLDLAGERDAPASVNAVPSRADIDARLRVARARLADLDRTIGRPDALPDEREELAATLDGLLVPCLKCHVMAGPRLATVRVAEPVMARSVFTHAPHVMQTACVSCHRKAETSKLSTDILVPGVANCQSCHAPSQVAAECETCHRYHPKSLSSLVMLP